MPKQSELRLIKRCRLYEKRGNWDYDLPATRGFYVLYQKVGGAYNVKYIGVGGIGNVQKTGIFGRLKNHHKNKKDWDHYSFFEVHDNISKEEIRELEILFLTIFRHDNNVKLLNKQLRAKEITRLSHKDMWADTQKK